MFTVSTMRFFFCWLFCHVVACLLVPAKVSKIIVARFSACCRQALFASLTGSWLDFLVYSFLRDARDHA